MTLMMTQQTRFRAWNLPRQISGMVALMVLAVALTLSAPRAEAQADAAAPAGTGTAFGVPGSTAAPGIPAPATAAPTTATAAPGTPGTTGTPTGPAAPLPPRAAGPGFELLIPMVVLVVLMIGMSVITGRREKKRRETMMNSLGKQDQVQTSGGIIGTVTEIGQDYVVIRLEEGRMRVAKSAIAGILNSAGGAR
ncbi:MAG: preprotein translocase subunit YajC [Planctomycetota bacterium]|nr:preprotein translocase subunit YajC [Planctomycetota bacterium]